MRPRIHSALQMFASLLRKTWERFRRDTRIRYGCFTLAADGFGLALVYILTKENYLGNVTANVAVSKGMAPVGLLLNSLALTGRLIPTRQQAANWFTSWLPTSLMNTGYMIMLLSMVSLSSTSARVLVGITFFPFDYVLKKNVIFGKYGGILRYHLFQTCVYYRIGGLLKAENGPGLIPGPSTYILLSEASPCLLRTLRSRLSRCCLKQAYLVARVV